MEQITIKIDLSKNKKQELAYSYLADDTNTIVGYGGSVNSGKSYLASAWLFSCCIAYPGVRYFIGRSELKLLRSTFRHTFDKLLRDQGLIPDETYTWNGQDNFILFPNGSRIDLLDLKWEPSDEEYQRLGSYEFTGGVIEEIAEVHEKAFQVLITRIGRCNNEEYGLKAKILCTMNPSKNWIKRSFYDRWVANELPSDIKFVQATPADNPYVTEDYKNMQLNHLPKNERERLWYGNWEASEPDENALVTYDEILEAFETDVIVPEDKNYITADIARFGKDSTVVCLWSGLRLEKVQLIKGKSTEETAQFIQGWMQDYKIPANRVIADEIGVGGGVVDKLKIKGFIANARPLNGANYSDLKSQGAFKLADMIRRKEFYFGITDSYKKARIIEELEACLVAADLDSDGRQRIIKKDIVKAKIGRSPDFADAIIMRCFFLSGLRLGPADYSWYR